MSAAREPTKLDEYSSDEEKNSEKSLSEVDAVDSERSRGVVGMERLSARLDRTYLVLIYGGFALLGTYSPRPSWFFSDDD